MGRFSISRKQPLAVRPPAYSYFVKKSAREYIEFENTRWRPRAVLALGGDPECQGPPLPSDTAAGTVVIRQVQCVPSFPCGVGAGSDTGASSADPSPRGCWRWWWWW